MLRLIAALVAVLNAQTPPEAVNQVSVGDEATQRQVRPSAAPFTADPRTPAGSFEAEQFELGSASAPISVVEYLSVTCSHCAAFERDTWPEVDRQWVRTGKVRFILRELPTAPVAVSAAGFLLARCAGEPRYWSVVQALLARQGEVLSAASLPAAVELEARVAGLDRASAQRCLSDPAAIDASNARRQAGLDAGVNSTPYFIINDRPLLPGVRLAGEVYEGGEISITQFDAAVRRAQRPDTRTRSQLAPIRARAR